MLAWEKPRAVTATVLTVAALTAKTATAPGKARRTFRRPPSLARPAPHPNRKTGWEEAGSAIWGTWSGPISTGLPALR